jgi:subtilisin family serine protease
MLRRRARLVFAFVAAILVVVLGASASAGAGTVPGGAANESAQAWFVELASPPAAKGTSKAKLKDERDAFYANAALQGLSVKQRYAFDTLWNGVSVDIPREQAGALATVPGVKAVYPVVPMTLAEDEPAADEPAADGEVATPAGVADPDLAFSTGMIGAPAANAAGWTGKGVKIGIIDSGVDYTNPDLSDGFGAGHRVAGGWDFVGDDYDAASSSSTYQPIPHPDPDPAPCDPVKADAIAARPGASSASAGHGTHVAGIAAAKAAGPGGVTGVAPEATIYAYRVFGCVGATDADVMAAAMQRAADDHVQVVNMSIGSAFANWPEYPTAVSADNLVGQGVVVVASIGNSGANGLFSAGAPGVGKNVIGVASVQNLALPALTFTVDNGTPTPLRVPYLQLQSTKEAPTAGVAGDIVYVGRGCLNEVASPPPGNDPVPAGGDPYLADPKGKVALIRRGVCTFNEKYDRAVKAGAIGVIVMNQGNAGRTGLFAGGSVVDLGVPGVTISSIDGDAIIALTTSRTMTWSDVRVIAPDPNAGLISDFSSWGLDAHLTLKPDISAPGGNITSTWPMTQFGGHNTISGTSMASPHVAGAAADYLQAHPGARPAEVRAALMNTSVPFLSLLGVTDSTARQGAGLVNVPNAIGAPVSISPSKISLGEGEGGPTVLTLRNTTASPITYNLSRTSALANGPSATTQYPFTFGNFFASIPVAFSANPVVVPANGTAQVTVTINAPAFAAKTIYGGFINATPVEGGTRLRVPFAGFKGDYQSIVAIGNGGCNLPMLARFGADTDKIDCAAGNPAIKGLIGQPAGGTWATPKQDPLILLYHLDHQVAAETVTLIDAATGAPVTQGGRIPTLEANSLLPRNSTPTTFFAFVWDGTQAFMTGNGKVQRKATPAGVYKLKFTITKATALNDTRAAQTETWTSPAITLRGD